MNIRLPGLVVCCWLWFWVVLVCLFCALFFVCVVSFVFVFWVWCVGFSLVCSYGFAIAFFSILKGLSEASYVKNPLVITSFHCSSELIIAYLSQEVPKSLS